MLRSPAPAVLVLLALVLAAPAPVVAQPTDADVDVAEAILAVEDKQWDKALDLLRRALARQPDHVEALYYTGVAYMGKRQPAAAVPVLQRARQLSPAESSIALQLGLAYVALEQYDRAATILEEAFAREPGLDSLGYYVGFLRYRKESTARHPSDGRQRAAARLLGFRSGFCRQTPPLHVAPELLGHLSGANRSRTEQRLEAVRAALKADRIASECGLLAPCTLRHREPPSQRNLSARRP